MFRPKTTKCLVHLSYLTELSSFLTQKWRVFTYHLSVDIVQLAAIYYDKYDTRYTIHYLPQDRAAYDSVDVDEKVFCITHALMAGVLGCKLL